MVDWNCRVCQKKQDKLIWFENRGCKDWCENKVLCGECARHVNMMEGKTFFCGTCQIWKNRWVVRNGCEVDCSKKKVCEDCGETGTTYEYWKKDKKQ
jgi:hypothetical protein